MRPATFAPATALGKTSLPLPRYSRPPPPPTAADLHRPLSSSSTTCSSPSDPSTSSRSPWPPAAARAGARRSFASSPDGSPPALLSRRPSAGSAASTTGGPSTTAAAASSRPSAHSPPAFSSSSSSRASPSSSSGLSSSSASGSFSSSAGTDRRRPPPPPEFFWLSQPSSSLSSSSSSSSTSSSSSASTRRFPPDSPFPPPASVHSTFPPFAYPERPLPTLTPYSSSPLPSTPAQPQWDPQKISQSSDAHVPQLDFKGPKFFAPGAGALSDEQKAVHDLVVDQGTSLFYTGSAGTGKSILLKQIIASLRKKYPPDEYPNAVAVTASTGIAGYNIGGHTLHSFAGIGLGDRPVDELAKEVAKTPRSRRKWRDAKVLIIDEISMIDGGLLDKLAVIGSHVREDPRPFGGLQLVLSGDFLQLPPVTKGNAEPRFAFEADVWPYVIERMISLTTVFRQRDPTFVNMLNEMRFGEVSAGTVDRFHALAADVEYPDGVEPTELFPLRGQVAVSNARRMAAIQAEERTFKAEDNGFMLHPRFPATLREHLLRNLMAPQALALKPGAQVMLIVNQPQFGLYNGSVGIVRKFVDGFPRVVFTTMTGAVVDVVVRPSKFSVEGPGGKVVGFRAQLPLILAWALSIHKSQGQTLDRVRVDLSRVFARGQAYVGLSRVTSLEGLQVLGFRREKVLCHPKVTEWNATALEQLNLNAPASAPAAPLNPSSSSSSSSSSSGGVLTDTDELLGLDLTAHPDSPHRTGRPAVGPYDEIAPLFTPGGV